MTITTIERDKAMEELALAEAAAKVAAQLIAKALRKLEALWDAGVR